MDAHWEEPLEAPSLEPFTEGSPLVFDPPMIDGSAGGWPDEIWDVGKMAPVALRGIHTHGALQWSSTSELRPLQHGFSGPENFPLNLLPPAPNSVLEPDTIMPFSLAANGYSAPDLAIDPCLNVNRSPETFLIPQDPGIDWMLQQASIPDALQLSELSEAHLEKIAKDVSEALALVKQKRTRESEKALNLTEHQKKIRRVDEERKGTQDKPLLFRCEEAGCDTTFRRNKDRLRHVRTKHQHNPGLTCPIVDCPMGTGHTMIRVDKLREHLRNKSGFTRSWRCIIHNCSEVGQSRNWWYSHIAAHGQNTRFENKTTLWNYGFGDFYQGYFNCKNWCTREGCPFGTNNLEKLEEHLSIPHEGPHCPCPIPACTSNWKCWKEVEHHLAVGHSGSDREIVCGKLLDQKFNFMLSAFTCPILSCDQVIKCTS